MVIDVSEHLSVEKLKGTDKVSCLLCSKSMQLYHMRDHVGCHILHARREHENNVSNKLQKQVNITVMAPLMRLILLL
jgi:hypothetical protein